MTEKVVKRVVLTDNLGPEFFPGWSYPYKGWRIVAEKLEPDPSEAEKLAKELEGEGNTGDRCTHCDIVGPCLSSCIHGRAAALLRSQAAEIAKLRGRT